GARGHGLRRREAGRGARRVPRLGAPAGGPVPRRRRRRPGRRGRAAPRRRQARPVQALPARWRPRVAAPGGPRERLVAGALGALGGVAVRLLGGGRLVPFGRYLLVGALASLFVGDAVIAWYLGLLAP